ncbi:hypothetical protein AV530_002711 [Patagioenas fasciata monilis]|uniref:Uncharacterized protein n=1 Tax=Patagioenas fasciata monilis TaxID=372326 RepID=A0A1V4IQ23_PATFA|nr:hypothetical protein AV530_002711 [Patagioenas fasciata monilis]
MGGCISFQEYLPCRSLHNSSSHSEYSCTVVMAHNPAWICIPQEGMFFIAFCTALLLLIGTSCCPWGNPWATTHHCPSRATRASSDQSCLQG